MAAKSKESTPGVNTNPSGATDEELEQGAMVGKVRGPDVDSSYHVYEFTDPNTGEPVEWTPVVHDVLVSSDGTTEKGDAQFVHASGEGEGGASGGEGGENNSRSTKK